MLSALAEHLAAHARERVRERGRYTVLATDVDGVFQAFIRPRGLARHVATELRKLSDLIEADAAHAAAEFKERP